MIIRFRQCLLTIVLTCLAASCRPMNAPNSDRTLAEPEVSVHSRDEAVSAFEREASRRLHISVITTRVTERDYGWLVSGFIPGPPGYRAGTVAAKVYPSGEVEFFNTL